MPAATGTAAAAAAAGPAALSAAASVGCPLVVSASDAGGHADALSDTHAKILTNYNRFDISTWALLGQQASE